MLLYVLVDVSHTHHIHFLLLLILKGFVIYAYVGVSERGKNSCEVLSNGNRHVLKQLHIYIYGNELT